MDYHAMSARDVARAMKTDIKQGLSGHEAAARRKAYGKNEIHRGKTRGPIRKFLAQFADVMVIILLISAAVSWVAARISGENGSADALIILLIVFVNAVIGFVQESRAEPCDRGASQAVFTACHCCPGRTTPDDRLHRSCAGGSGFAFRRRYCARRFAAGGNAGMQNGRIFPYGRIGTDPETRRGGLFAPNSDGRAAHNGVRFHKRGGWPWLRYCGGYRDGYGGGAGGGHVGAGRNAENAAPAAPGANR